MEDPTIDNTRESNFLIAAINAFKDKKTKGIINVYTSIVFDIKNKEIRICNDAGRLTRPVLRVRDNKVFITDKIIKELNAENLTWDDLLTDTKIDEAIIEYIDPEEQSFMMIATKPKDLIQASEKKYMYTHCEIHPSMMFGVLTANIPYAEHNPAPRNMFQAAQAKQAMGIYTTSFKKRRRALISLTILSAISFLAPLSSRLSK